MNPTGILSPVSPEPLPIKLVAVTTPTTLIPDELTVTAVPTLRVDAVATPTIILGVPERPVALPLKFPLKVVAVTIPDETVTEPNVEIPVTFRLSSCPCVVTIVATL